MIAPPLQCRYDDWFAMNRVNMAVRCRGGTAGRPDAEFPPVIAESFVPHQAAISDISMRLADLILWPGEGGT